MREIDQIEAIICTGENLNPTLLRLAHKTRTAKEVFARHLIFYFARKYTKLSYNVIGKIYHKDHSTTIHSIKVIDNYLNYDKQLAPIIANYDVLMAQNIKQLPAEVYNLKNEIMSEIAENRAISMDLVNRYNELINVNPETDKNHR